MICLKYALEDMFQNRVNLQHDHCALPFLILDAVDSVNKGRRGPDGKTPYELRYGKPWNGRMEQFGRKVMFLEVGPHGRRIDKSYKTCVFLGCVG